MTREAPPLGPPPLLCLHPGSLRSSHSGLSVPQTHLAALTSTQHLVTRGLFSVIQVPASVIRPVMGSLLQIRLLPPNPHPWLLPFPALLLSKRFPLPDFVLCVYEFLFYLLHLNVSAETRDLALSPPTSPVPDTQ